ncbi:MAG: hypothetical protein J2P54_17695 [Bradyrhizobiaceae bacterium]|nr:hypothetical protein [Bradyrhizobiaceae bacterium]
MIPYTAATLCAEEHLRYQQLIIHGVEALRVAAINFERALLTTDLPLVAGIVGSTQLSRDRWFRRQTGERLGDRIAIPGAAVAVAMW